MTHPATDPPVERYLDRVRTSLRGLPGPEVEEIVLELRGHITERSESKGDLEAALRSLGDPEELARQYRVDSVAAQAQCSGSPIVILHSLMLLRRRSLAGWVALVLAAFGYAWGIALGGAAIEKILSPRDVGLWLRPGALALPRITVDGPGPPGTREVLGWWFLPLGLAACAVLLFLTRRFALWWIQRRRAARESHSW
jgi:hypothetical protein